MPTLKYWDAAKQAYFPILAAQKGDKGDKGDPGDPGPPGSGGPLDGLSDVLAPADTPTGKLLGTTAEGSWGPVDPPITGITQEQADARYVNASGDSMTGALSVTGTVTATGTVSGAEATAAGHLATKGYVDSRIWSGTQAQYDALPTKNPSVLYVVV